MQKKLGKTYVSQTLGSLHMHYIKTRDVLRCAVSGNLFKIETGLVDFQENHLSATSKITISV